MASNAENVSNWWRHHVLWLHYWVHHPLALTLEVISSYPTNGSNYLSLLKFNLNHVSKGAPVLYMPLLSIVINQSLSSGIFPNKIATVIPFFKKKSEIQLLGNCHPISLLSSVSKVFEKAAYGQLYQYFSTHALSMTVNTAFENITQQSLLRLN